MKFVAILQKQQKPVYHMLKKLLIVFSFFSAGISAKAQLMESFLHSGEIGIGVGMGHYFGDLNPEIRFNRPKTSFGLFYRKQINNYISVRLSGEYALLGYSDRYSNNDVQRARNLSFNSNVWEVGISGDFNFFRFQPGFEEFSFTPYIGLGIGAFSYDPYAYLGGQKYFLRLLGTEGQGSSLYLDRQYYNPVAISIPFTLGAKYALNARTNVFAELIYRFTNTDFLDDVSGQTYAPDAFSPLPDGSPSPAFLLHDRSYETGASIGMKGRQRGNSLKADAFATIKVGISFNLHNYRCPTY